MALKAYKYYAIRVQNTIVIRRSLVGLKIITSILSKPNTDFLLKQTTYSGGVVIGSLPYKEWVGHGGPTIGAYRKVDRTLVRSMQPYLLGVEAHGIGTERTE